MLEIRQVGLPGRAVQCATDSCWTGEFRIEDCGENVVWVSVDPPDVSLDEFPLYEHASPIEVECLA